MPTFLSAAAVVLVGILPLAAGCSSTSGEPGAGGGSGGSGGDGGGVDATQPGRDASTDASTEVLDVSVPEEDVGRDTLSDASRGDCGVHDGDECDLVRQSCPNAKETCVYDATKKHAACQVRVDGPAERGELCDAKTPCDKGLFCIASKCTPACCLGDNSVCGPKGTCTVAIVDAEGKPTFNVCAFASVCHPFKYDCPDGEVCLFSEAPDVFKCARPAPGIEVDQPPGDTCAYVNECGESQQCIGIGGGEKLCTLFCLTDAPKPGDVGADPKGRFPANGTCTVGGKSYGTCRTRAPLSPKLGRCLL